MYCPITILSTTEKGAITPFLFLVRGEITPYEFNINC